MTIKGMKAAFQRDKKALRELKGHRRLEFIWDYYKIPVLAVASVLALFLLASVFNMGRGEISMYAVLVNADEETESHVFDELLARGGAQAEGRTVDVVSSYRLGDTYSEAYDAETIQVLAARFAIGDLDLFGADEAVFHSYATQDAFVDLSLFIDREILEQHQADLYTYENADGVEIVGGIWLHEGSPIHQAGYYSGDVLFGIAQKAEHMDEAIVIIFQLLEEN